MGRGSLAGMLHVLHVQQQSGHTIGKYASAALRPMLCPPLPHKLRTWLVMQDLEKARHGLAPKYSYEEIVFCSFKPHCLHFP